MSWQDFRSIQGIYLFDEKAGLMPESSDAPDIDWKDVPAIQVIERGSSHIVSIEGMPRPFALVVVPVMETEVRSPAGALAAVLDLSTPTSSSRVAH